MAKFLVLRCWYLTVQKMHVDYWRLPFVILIPWSFWKMRLCMYVLSIWLCCLGKSTFVYYVMLWYSSFEWSAMSYTYSSCPSTQSYNLDMLITLFLLVCFLTSFCDLWRYGESFPVSQEVLDPSFTLPIGKAKVSCFAYLTTIRGADYNLIDGQYNSRFLWLLVFW